MIIRFFMFHRRQRLSKMNHSMKLGNLFRFCRGERGTESTADVQPFLVAHDVDHLPHILVRDSEILSDMKQKGVIIGDRLD